MQYWIRGRSSAISQSIPFIDQYHSSQIFARNIPIQKLNVNWLRSQLGLVSSTAGLLDRSVEDNLAYGDNSREVTSEEMEWATRQANVYSDIMDLPNVSIWPSGKLPFECQKVAKNLTYF